MEGVRYCHMGRSPEQGFDCLGQVYYFFKRIGLPVFVPPEGTRYPRDYWKAGVSFTYLNKLSEQFSVIPERCAQFGDVYVFVAKPGTGMVAHTGIVMDPAVGRFQHVVQARPTGYNTIRERFWAARLHGVMRYRRMDLLHRRVASVPKELKV